MFEQVPQSETKKSKLETLYEQGRVHFDVGMTSEEREGFQEIRIEQEAGQFTYAGPADDALKEKLIDHLVGLGGNKQEILETVAKCISRIARGHQEDFQQEAVWVIVRVTLPNNFGDVPRWHQDGYYLTAPEERTVGKKEYKLVFTPKGSTKTRFAEIVDKAEYERLEKAMMENAIANEENNPEVYEAQDIALRKAIEATVQEVPAAKEGEATIYEVGGEEAKVHSEPPMHEPRIFMSVSAGSLKDVESYRTHYERKY